MANFEKLPMDGMASASGGFPEEVFYKLFLEGYLAYMR